MEFIAEHRTASYSTDAVVRGPPSIAGRVRIAMIFRNPVSRLLRVSIHATLLRMRLVPPATGGSLF
jgi:hypothetical protein